MQKVSFPSKNIFTLALKSRSKLGCSAKKEYVNFVSMPREQITAMLRSGSEEMIVKK
jgi:hypothetical protein